MTSLQRIRTVLSSLLVFVVCGVLIWQPDLGFYIVAAILCLTLIVRGLGALVYYAAMARHMVGGKLQLYKGIIMTDIGLFFLTLDDIPRAYLMLYLLIGSLAAGIIDILRALEARRMEAAAWRLNMASGIVNVVTGIACIFCIRRPDVLVYIYASGLFYSACLRFATAFRRSAIIYIP